MTRWSGTWHCTALRSSSTGCNKVSAVVTLRNIVSACLWPLDKLPIQVEDMPETLHKCNKAIQTQCLASNITRFLRQYHFTRKTSRLAYSNQDNILLLSSFTIKKQLVATMQLGPYYGLHNSQPCANKQHRMPNVDALTSSPVPNSKQRWQCSFFHATEHSHHCIVLFCHQMKWSIKSASTTAAL